MKDLPYVSDLPDGTEVLVRLITDGGVKGLGFKAGQIRRGKARRGLVDVYTTNNKRPPSFVFFACSRAFPKEELECTLIRVLPTSSESNKELPNE